MRIWEFEDDKAIPADLVREQDFIMRVRRLNRAGDPYLVINLVLSAIRHVHKNQSALEATQQRLQEFGTLTGGLYYEMSNGDVFLVWNERPEIHTLPAQLAEAIMPEGAPAGDTGKFLLVFRLPGDYTKLRARANDYVEAAQAEAAAGDTAPEQALKSAAARGPLTAWSVDQIEKLLGEIDLQRYVRAQPICEYQAGGGWQPVIEEHFVSFEDLRRERFPNLECDAPEHLFLELCQALDRRLLAELTQRFDRIADRRVHLNLSVASVMLPVFAQFCFGVPKAKRGLIGFELHRGDLLQDFTLTLNAMMALHREGFRVAIDGVPPDLVNYLNLAAFEADTIKIDVSKDRAALLADPAIRAGLAGLPKEKLIFFRCDNEEALKAGLEMGVGLFQGWLIDEKIGKAAG